MNAFGHALESCSSHLAPPQSKWVFLPRLGGCESLSAALSQSGAVVHGLGSAHAPAWMALKLKRRRLPVE
jgi:hypothetical protein